MCPLLQVHEISGRLIPARDGSKFLAQKAHMNWGSHYSEGNLELTQRNRISRAISSSLSCKICLFLTPSSEFQGHSVIFSVEGNIAISPGKGGLALHCPPLPSKGRVAGEPPCAPRGRCVSASRLLVDATGSGKAP